MNPSMLLPVIAIALSMLSLGKSLGKIATREDYQKQAVAHECAVYRADGEFEWVKP